MKYFYTCPIKAAYMAKYWGLKIIGDCAYVECSADSVGYTAFSGMNDDAGKYYIHPDSMPIFEPKIGDAVIDHETGIPARLVSELHKSFHDESKIIQRNGIAFMWPEVEL